MVDGKCVCAFTVIQYNFPRHRQMYMSYIGGSKQKKVGNNLKNGRLIKDATEYQESQHRINSKALEATFGFDKEIHFSGI